MVTRLEGHVDLGAARFFASLLEGDDFRVGSAGMIVITFADNLPILDDNASDMGIGRGNAGSAD